MTPELSSPEYTTPPKPRRCGHSGKVLIVVLLLAAVYSIAWYYMASSVEKHVRQSQQDMQEHGIMLTCGDLHKTGYPLRIAMACDSLDLQQPRTGLSLTGARLVAGAPVYAPNWVSFDVTAPVRLDMPGLEPLLGQWDSIRLEVNSGQKPFGGLVLTAENAQIATLSNMDAQTFLTTEFIHLKADSKQDILTTKLAFDTLRFPWLHTASGQSIPALDGHITLSLDGAQQLFSIVSQERLLAQGQEYSGTVEQFSISPESGGTLTLSGPFSISGDGLLNGHLILAVHDGDALKPLLRDLFPDQAGNFDALFFAIGSMKKNDQGDPQVEIDIKNGIARTGFIKLGKIPPLVSSIVE